MRMLITGAEGFTGQYMAAELKANGHEVYGLARDQMELAGLDVVRIVDLLDVAGLQTVLGEVRPHAVVHLAGIAFVAHGEIDEMYRTNVVGTRNLLQALVNTGTGASGVLVASSANVYGNVKAERLDESLAPQPANDYAVSKLAMEYVTRLYAARLPIILTRPFNYTGVGQSPSFLIPKIIDHFRRHADVIELGNLDVWRDFLDVRSVVAYYRRLLDSPAAVGGTFNIASGEVWSLAQVLAMVVELSGHELEVHINPAFVRNDEVKKLCGSPDRLHSVVGIVPRIELSETLRWMLEAP